jgi:hypothetical protein
VWEELQKRLKDYSLIRKYAEKWVKSLSGMNKEDELEQVRLQEMIKKLNMEESRYAKAYGAETLDFEQFHELVSDVKKRRNSYQKQINILASKNKQLEIQIDVDDLVAEAIKVIENLDLSNKFKVVSDIIRKVIIGERSGIEVWINLPLPVVATEKLGYEPISRDSGAD